MFSQYSSPQLSMGHNLEIFVIQIHYWLFCLLVCPSIWFLAFWVWIFCVNSTCFSFDLLIYICPGPTKGSIVWKIEVSDPTLMIINHCLSIVYTNSTLSKEMNCNEKTGCLINIVKFSSIQTEKMTAQINPATFPPGQGDMIKHYLDNKIVIYMSMPQKGFRPLPKKRHSLYSVC